MFNKKNIPKDYFDKLPGKIFESVDLIEDALSEDAPLLFRESQKNPYKVPVEYFQKSRAQILKTNRSVKRLNFRPLLAAASLAFIAVISWTIVQSNDLKIDDEFAESDVWNYYLENVDDMDDDVFQNVYAEAISEEESEELYEEDILLNLLLDEFSDNELEGLN